MDPNYLEHDTYWMFVEIMKNMSQYFYHEGVITFFTYCFDLEQKNETEKGHEGFHVHLQVKAYIYKKSGVF